MAILSFIYMICTPGKMYAQTADTLSVLKLFMQVCNSYKQFPLHVNLSVQNSTDISTNPEADTAAYNMEFFIQDKGAYIKMGNNEEVINDSLILIISQKPKHMALYANTKHSMAEQMTMFTGGLTQDSSLQKFAARYRQDENNSGVTPPGLAVIKIRSRETVLGSMLAKETIEATYKRDSKLPVKVVQLHRKLIPVDSATYVKLLSGNLYAGKLVHPAGHYWFIIKQSVSTYIFNQIDYDVTTQLPLQVDRCIVKKQTPAGGEHYQPANGYEMFRLTENL